MAQTTNSQRGRRLLVLVIGLVALAAALGAWWTWGRGPVSASETVVVIHSSNGSHAFNVELADTPDTRARGLMFRQELAPDAGMLFDYGAEQMASFWMENTYIPLDMVFIKADGRIESIHLNARPLDRTPSRSAEPVRFVLEVIGGRTAELGIAPGDRVDHPRIPAP